MEVKTTCWKETAQKEGIILTGFAKYSDALPSKRKLEELFPGSKFNIDRQIAMTDWSISKIS